MNNIQARTNWFLDQLAVFQAANSDYQSIKNNFIVRKTEFSIIIDAILNKKTKDPLQHELILGRRGSGKSTLLKRIEIEVVENPKLNKKFIAINLAEEQAGIYRLFDLWEQVLEELKHQTNIEISIPEYSSFEDNHAYTRQLYTLIHDVCVQSKKRIILLLDNFDRIVENFEDDGSLLRETLINYNDIQIIAGSTRMDEHFWRYDRPFYEFFRRHRLEALSREEINLLLIHWSESLEIPALTDFVKNNPGKIENIRILTDGLPRTLQFFIQIVLQKPGTSTYEYLKKTMDNVSPLFQERLNALPAQLRKTVLEMSFIWEAGTTKQLVEKTRMESKLVSANLKTLVDKGLVDKIETNKKQHLYRLSERFFNMWLMITQGNPEQKRKAKWLSIFLENWYDATDFKRLTSEHIANLKSGKIDWNQALVSSKALSQSKYISLDERDIIIELTEKIRSEDIRNCMIELPEKYKNIFPKISKYVKEENYNKAIELVKEIENEADGEKFMQLGILYLMQKDYLLAEKDLLSAVEKGVIQASFLLGLLYEIQEKFSEAEKYYLMAIEKGNTDAFPSLANLYEFQEKYPEAEKYYLMAIEKGDNVALFNLALLYDNQEKFPEAEKYYLMAFEKGDNDALFNLALLYNNQEKFLEAEKYYLMAIEKGDNVALFNLALLYDNQEKYTEAEKHYLMAIKKGNANALNNLALLYKNQEKLLEAEKYYLMAIEKGNTEALNNLALLYKNQEKFHEAEKYYLMAIEKGDNDALFNLALLYKNQEKFPEAEKYYLMTIEKGDTDALNNLANLYQDQGRFEEAEKYFLLAIEKDDIKAFFNLANLYRNMERFGEAEKYYLKAIEKEFTNAINNLANLYQDQGRFEEAEKYFLLAIEKDDKKALNNLALLYDNQEKFSEAEKYYLMAIEKGSQNALNNLALLYDNQKKFPEAEKYYLLAIEKGDINALCNLAYLYYEQAKYAEAEKHYLLAIKKGDVMALNDLAYMYYKTNINKAKAIEYINNACEQRKEKIYRESQLIIELWNGIFNDVENRIISIAKEKNSENMEEFIIDLLVQQQKTLVLRLFQNAEFGAQLQDKYLVLHYVTLLLNNIQDDNLKLRIPPELQSTIDDVLEKIAKQQQLYSSNKSTI